MAIPGPAAQIQITQGGQPATLPLVAVSDSSGAQIVPPAAGTPGTGITQPTGGSGQFGWLSGIFSKLPAALGGTVSSASLPVVIASDNYPSVRQLASPGQICKQQSYFSPGGQGDNIYQMLRAVRNGRPTLIGTVSKGGMGIVDFMTGEVLYNFGDFGGPIGPSTAMLGFDSYAVCCEWQGWYVFGGWVKAPAVIGATNSQTNKYSYVVASKDLVNWTVIVKDVALSSTTYQAEVSDVVAAPTGLYILRGDYSGGTAASANTGIWKWTGTGSPAVLGSAGNYSPYKGCIVDDFLWCVQFNSSTFVKVDLLNSDALTTAAMSPGTSRAGGGSYTVPSGSQVGQIINMGRVQVHGHQNGFWIRATMGDGSPTFIPLFVCPNVGGSADLYRVAGWRSKTIQCAGGVVFACNTDGSSDNVDSNPSYLVHLTNGGRLKVLAQGGFFGGLELYGDRLYYGVQSGYHQDTYSNCRNLNPVLMSMPIEQVLNGVPPAICENISLSYTTSSSGVLGWFGGYPTLGYSRGMLTINASSTGNLTIATYAPTRNSSSVSGVVDWAYTVVSVVANTPLQIDLAPYLKSGDIMAFSYSVNATINARIALQPA